MGKTYHITIEGLKDPRKFVLDWSKIYNYGDDQKYTNNIKRGLVNDKSLTELFEWKNGTRDNIAEKKMFRVADFISKREAMKKLKKNFKIEDFEQLIEPHKGSVIWKIFLLHIIQPEHYPIYDQHVYRSFRFFTTGVIQDISNRDKEKYDTYKTEYVDWFNKLKVKYDLSPRDMDKSFFMFGKTLKSLSSKPIKVYELGV